MEKLGSEVVIVSADVANPQQMEAAIAVAEERFGQLNGVFHAAGIVGGHSFAAIDGMTPTECEQQFQPKVYGTKVLEKVLNNRELDFCLLFSSISSVLGGLGLSAYAAANLFMDTFVHQHNQIHPVPWIGVNWDAWKVEAQQQSLTSVGANLADLAITPEEGADACQRILSSGNLTQVIVSTGDLQGRINQWIKLDFSDASNQLQLEVATTSETPPSYPNGDIAPRKEIEQTIADVWCPLLGVEQVGIDDDFFDIGGDSLIAIQLICKLREIFMVELSVHILFEQPTIAQLAETIEQSRQSASENGDKLSQILQMVEQLSEVELQAILEK